MPFVNEKQISDADINKYKLLSIDASYRKNARPHDWTVDRGRNIHLRLIQYGGRDPENNSASFSFYWKDRELPVYLWLADYESKERDVATLVWRMRGVGSDKSVQWLPETHEPYRPQIIADLKEALVARNGIIATDECTTCITTFEF
jgi:hypothetical protein